MGQEKKHYQPSCCLMILNYNGQEHLKYCLPSALAASETLGWPCPVIVVDNQSTEDDVAYIRRNFPQVEVVVAKKNDYLFSLNDAVAHCSEEIVVLLNNDMRFDSNFVEPLLLRYFDDPGVFAVGARI